MAKAKSQKNERQAKIDAIRGQQQSAERRRGLMIIGVCVVMALLIIAFPVYSILKDRQQLSAFNDLDLEAIGAPASSCEDIITEPVTEEAEHRPTNEQITYEDAPPTSGPHWSEAGIAPAVFERKFYEVEDRPEVESLVHNLEHGYTILWYDETIAEDDAALTELRGLASKFAGSDNFRSKFIAAPWTSEDGEAFPDGASIAISHWSVGGEGGDPSGEQIGVRQYCSETSGKALDDFMTEYPYTDSPEPDAG